MSSKLIKYNFFIYFFLTIISICCFHLFNLFFISQINDVTYSPLNLLTGFIPYDELAIYGPRISEAFEGSFFLSDSYTFEHQNKLPYFAPFLAENIAAISLWITNNNITYSQLLLDLIFPALIFIMIYKIFIILKVQEAYSALFSSIITVFYDFFSIIMTNPFALIALKIFPFEQHLLTRSILAICIFVGLIAINRTILFYVNSTKKNFFLALIFNACLIYFNIFVFIFVTFFNLCSLLFSQYSVNWNFIRTNFLAFITFMIIISFYFVNQYYLFQNPDSNEIVARVGIATIRGVSLLSLVYLALLVLSLYFRKHIPKICFIILCSTLTSLIISKNLQIFIGFNPQIFHYDRDIGRWVLLISFFTLIYPILKKKLFFNTRFNIKFVSVLISLLVLIFQFNFTNKNYSKYTLKNDYVELFSFLNSSTAPNSIIIANLDLTKWISTFTHNNTYIAISPASVVSEREAIQRFTDGYKKLGFSKKEILNLVGKKVYVDLFHLKNRYVMSSLPMEDVEMKISKSNKRFTKLIIDSLNANNSKKFLYDYVLYQKIKDNFSYNNTVNNSIVFENDNFILLKVKKL